MPDSEVNNNRGHPNEVDNKEYEYNSYVGRYVCDSIFSCGIFDCFSKEQIDNILRDPITYHTEAIELANFIYNKNGIVANSIDYMDALMCLDRVITNKSKKPNSRTQKNKELMKSTLHTIDDKAFIRDALHTEMNNGICFYYFETTQKNKDMTKFMQDYEVENIYEINEMGVNASIITLPYQYTKIVGKKNGRYVLAFNLRYFDDFTGEKLERKLRKYPREICKAYMSKSHKGDWVVLDNNKTICKKIKCKDSEPWGRPLAISALDDILYADSVMDFIQNFSEAGIDGESIVKTYLNSDQYKENVGKVVDAKNNEIRDLKKKLNKKTAKNVIADKSDKVIPIKGE